jgi:hypothetical protein
MSKRAAQLLQIPCFVTVGALRLPSDCGSHLNFVESVALLRALAPMSELHVDRSDLVSGWNQRNQEVPVCVSPADEGTIRLSTGRRVMSRLLTSLLSRDVEDSKVPTKYTT